MVERTDTPDLASAALGTADTRPDAAATSRDRAERLMDAFDAAADATLAERARILADLRAEDAALADEVEALLAADRGASPIDGPSPAERAVAFAADAVDLDDPGPIGGYRVIRRVGKGGMGVVYEAEQEQPRRRVALKVIRGAFAAPELVKRFEVEAHVLGRLTHDGIARVYAADLSARPPYIVMELIDGLPLDGFVATRGLDLRARVALLADVCDAVHHAHMSGVVHRDLKPGNILVTADGRPKVLDFGVARVLDQDTIHTGPAGQMTGAGDVVGTPAYMSPEQAVGDRDAIDARSDVYALGVILYELVCGRGPYDDAGPALLDVLTAIRDGRAVPLTKRARDVPADVALIVATAMAPERERRYASVAALADDLRRYLADRPIAARPPSVWYGLRKLARRNPLLVAAVAGLFAVLVGAVVVVSALYGEVDQARAVAEAAAADASAANATLRERNAELVLESARAALDANPTLALERLAGLDRAELPTDAPAWRDAFAVAWDATSRGVARAVYGGARAEVRWVEAPPDAAFVVTAAFDDTIRCYEPDGALRWARARPGHRPAWVRLAPGGELAASGGHDGAVVLWRVADGADVVLPGRHEGKVQSGAFSADGRLLATCGDDGALRLWDVAAATGRVLVRDDAVCEQVAWSGAEAARPLLAAALTSGGVRLWDLADDAGAWVLAGPAAVERVAVSPDGRWVAAGDVAGEVRAWSRDDGATRALAQHAGDLKSVLFAGDDAVVSAGRGGDIYRSPLAGPRQVLLRGGAPVRALAVDARGELVAAGGDDRVVRVWDGLGTEIGAFRGHEGMVRQVALAGDLVLSASNDGTARSFRLHAFGRRPLGAPGRALAWLPAPRPVAAFVTGGDDGAVWLHGMTPGQRTLLGGLGAPVEAVTTASAAPPGAPAIAAVSFDGQVALWDAAGRPRGRRALAARLEEVVLAPDGAWVAGAPDAPAIPWWDGRDGGEVVALRGHAGDVEHVIVTASGELWSGAEDGEVRRWALAPGAPPASAVAGRGDGPVRALVTAAGGAVAAGWESGDVLVWPPGATEPRRHHGDGAALAVALSPDGDVVAAGDSEGTVRVWRGGREVAAVAGAHRGPVAALAWLGSAADGAARLASGGADRTVRLYRVGADGVADAVVIHAWDGPLRGLAVSPDGRFVATVADEPWAQLWPSELPTGVAARAAVEAMLAREAVTLP